MIIDSLENASKYAPLNPLFKRAFAYLESPAAMALENDRAEIDGDRLYAIPSRKPGKKKSEAKLEIHRRYIDIHYIVKGIDTMGWKPAHRCGSILSAYKEEDDAATFNDEPACWCPVPAGSFAIFFPEDAHAPMVSDGEIHKVILKVAV